MLARHYLQKFPLLFQLLGSMVVFLLLITIWFTQPTFSGTFVDNWNRRGLDGLVITSLTADADNNDRLYATSRDTIGVRFSDNEGETWSRYDDGLIDRDVESLISCPSGWLFVGTWGDFVYRRMAVTGWTRGNTGSTEQLFVPAIACGAGAVVYAATSDKGVWRSTDNGENWQAINQGLTQQGVLSLAYANGRLYAGTARGVFVRQDSGVSWQLIGLADRSVSSLLITADTLWAGTDQGVFRTALITPPSWSAVGALAQVVYSMAFDGNQRLYMGTRDTGVYRFEAGAWQLFSTGLTPQRIYALRPRGASQLSLLAGTENGVWINEIQPPPTLTPTVTDTPAATATPTITPTPTPGIKTIRLHNDPQRELAGDDTVIYTIDLENGPFALTKVMVSNALPNEMMLVTDSMTGPADWVPSVKDRTIQWERSTLPEGATAQFAYRAVRYTPTSTPTPTLVATEPLTPTSTATATGTSGVPSTPTPVASPVDTVTETPTSVSTNLAITKIGPAEVAIGQDIRYHLIVTNPFTRPLTGMTIVDVIPVGAEVVDFGGGAMTMPPSAMLQWQVPVLNAQSTVTRTFAIRLPISRRLVVNDLYFVDVIENGVLRLRAVGKDPVVTTIMGGTLEPLQVTLFPATLPLTATTPITNNGAIVTWEYPGFDGQLVSNGVRNPPWRLYMPFIPR